LQRNDDAMVELLLLLTHNPGGSEESRIYRCVLRRINHFPDENPYGGSLRERVRHFIWRKIKSIIGVILNYCWLQLF
jgi:hypothetical protein